MSKPKQMIYHPLKNWMIPHTVLFHIYWSGNNDENAIYQFIDGNDLVDLNFDWCSDAHAELCLINRKHSTESYHGRLTWQRAKLILWRVFVLQSLFNLIRLVALHDQMNGCCVRFHHYGTIIITATNHIQTLRFQRSFLRAELKLINICWGKR